VRLVAILSVDIAAPVTPALHSSTSGVRRLHGGSLGGPARLPNSVSLSVQDDGSSLRGPTARCGRTAPWPPLDCTHFLSQCAGFVGMGFQNGYAVHTPEQVVRIFRNPGAPKR
jgi:hypothetical protein